MLNIILLILKIIGIILLSMLGLLLLIACLILFVPLRYRGSGNVQAGQKPDGEADIYWLLHALHVRVGYKAAGGAFFKFFLFGHEFGKKKEKKPKKKKPAKKQAVRRKPEKKPAAAGQEEVKPVAIPEKPAPTETMPAADKPEAHPVQVKPAASKPPIRKPEAREKKKPKAASVPKVSLLEKITDFISGIPGMICDLIERVVAACENLDETIGKISDRIDSLQRKIGPLIDSRSKAFYAKVWKKLRKMLHHWRIRRIRGHLNFGTGEPDRTGMLAGVVYLLLPASADRFSVEPNMWDRELDTEFVFEGHIRLWHALTAAVPILLDKNFRRTLGLLKKLRR